eukprot:1006294-Prorocentrum_minimum.AAC.2
MVFLLARAEARAAAEAALRADFEARLAAAEAQARARQEAADAEWRRQLEAALAASRQVAPGQLAPGGEDAERRAVREWESLMGGGDCEETLSETSGLRPEAAEVELEDAAAAAEALRVRLRGRI